MISVLQVFQALRNLKTQPSRIGIDYSVEDGDVEYVAVIVVEMTSPLNIVDPIQQELDQWGDNFNISCQYQSNSCSLYVVEVHLPMEVEVAVISSFDLFAKHMENGLLFDSLVYVMNENETLHLTELTTRLMKIL